jgi:MFS family permease
MARFLPRLDGLPRAYWALWAGTLVNRIGSFVLPFLAMYLTEQRHLSVARAGIVLALYGTGSVMAAPVGGALADRVGRKRTLVASLVLGSAAMIHLGLARAPLHVAVAAFLLGFLGDMYRPASQALIADLVKPEDRTRAYALVYWAVNLGFSFGPAIAGFLATGNFALLFYGDAATTLACAIVIGVLVPDPRAAKRGASAKPIEYFAPYRDAPFLAFVCLAFVVGVVYQQSASTLPIHLRAHGVAPSTYGLLFSLNAVLIVFIQPFVVGPIQKLRPERMLALGALLAGVGFGINALATTTLEFAVGVVVWTFGEIATVPVLSTFVAAVAPPDLRGSYQGVFGMSWSGATLAAPAVGAAVYGAFGPDALWAACFGAGASAAVGYLALGGAFRRRVAAAQPV